MAVCVALLGVDEKHLSGHGVYKPVGTGWEPWQSVTVPHERCRFLNGQDLDTRSIPAGLVLL